LITAANSIGTEDRLRAIDEAKRILKPGGILLAVAITRYAGLIYGVLRGHVFDPVYHRMIQTEVQTGRRENPPDWLLTFPDAFFHHPDELKAELQDGGLLHETTLGVLGAPWMVRDLDASWENEAQREVILEIAQLTEGASVLGLRLMAVARKAAGQFVAFHQASKWFTDSNLSQPIVVLFIDRGKECVGLAAEIIAVFEYGESY
jgi:SAM-dependent methyltransferase